MGWDLLRHARVCVRVDSQRLDVTQTRLAHLSVPMMWRMMKELNLVIVKAREKFMSASKVVGQTMSHMSWELIVPRLSDYDMKSLKVYDWRSYKKQKKSLQERDSSSSKKVTHPVSLQLFTHTICDVRVIVWKTREQVQFSRRESKS